MRTKLARLMFRWGWDTRCRHMQPARTLRSAIDALGERHQFPLLDVGCGDAGIAAFLPDIPVVGVDLALPQAPPPNLSFERATITDLPFPTGTFPLVSSIDVLEHLEPMVRKVAIAEVLRVARHGVLVACPQGAGAARCDTEFQSGLRKRGRPEPSWISEHQASPYPTTTAIVETIREIRPDARLSVSYSEPMLITRAVRGAATRSSALYGAVNLLVGSLVGMIPAPSCDRGYRVIVYAELP